jgi:hypothetical protein
LFDRFKIDELIEEHGHTILQLSPYHCHFNPIELVWSQAKRYYNSNIGRNGFGMEAIPLLILWNFVIDTMVQM